MIPIIVIIVFIVVLIIIAIFTSKNNKTIEAYADEIVLCEELSVQVEQRGAPRKMHFPNCKVVLSNKRITISQKNLFNNKFVLRHEILFSDDDSSQTNILQSLKSSALKFIISPQKIEIFEKESKTYVKIPIPDAVPVVNQYVIYETSQALIYKEFLAN